jgi:hypothetical protein
MAAGGAVVAAMVQAIKASGAIVRVSPDDFLTLLARAESPLVVTAQSRFFGTRHQYLMPYKGLVFSAVSPTPLTLVAGAEVIRAQKIWIPG